MGASHLQFYGADVRRGRMVSRGRHRRSSQVGQLCGYCGGPVPGDGLLVRLQSGVWSGFDSWPCLVRFASAELHPARSTVARTRHLQAVPAD
jgi:hypothetical protein